MVDETPEDRARRIADGMADVMSKFGESAWETVAGSTAIKLLASQETVSVADIITSIEREYLGSGRTKGMAENVISKLLELEKNRP